MKKLLLTSAMVLSVVGFSFAGEVKKASDISEEQMKCLQDVFGYLISAPEVYREAEHTILGAYLTQGYPPCEVVKIYKRMFKDWDFFKWKREHGW